MARACGVCRLLGKQFLQAFRTTRREIWQSARPQASANALQAASLPEQKELQPEVLSSLALQRLRELPAQEPANGLRGLAAALLSFKADVLAHVAEALRPRLKPKLPLALRPAELSSTLRACTVPEVGGWWLQADFASVLRQVLCGGSSGSGSFSSSGAQGVSNGVQSSAATRWQGRVTLASTRCRAQPLLPALSPQAAANASWTPGKPEARDPALLDEALVRVRKDVGSRFRAQELATTAWCPVSPLRRGEALPEFLGQEAAGRSLDVASRSMLLEALASAGRLRACEDLMGFGPLSLGLLPGAGAVLTLLETRERSEASRDTSAS
ncbi:unnamed protein product [Symbiodinium sp. CCMP2592]|nr:unnamed protein product [Symbiodinium sp. CCMP2592]